MQLTPQEIRSQLGNIPSLTLNDLVIINCWRVGNYPGMDVMNEVFLQGWIMDRYVSNFHNLADRLEYALRGEEAQLIMLCDLYAENNEPRESVTWTHENRVKGAILGVMSCLFQLILNPELRARIFSRPERFFIATIENGHIAVLQAGEGEKMITFLRDQES